MLNISRLLCGTTTDPGGLYYGTQGDGLPEERPQVVAWTTTRMCNLHCLHCYSDSFDRSYTGELTTEEARAMLRDMAAFGVPVIVLSGGEPLYREDIFKLAGYARSLNIRINLSTNGTLISPRVANIIRESGFGYVGINLYGLGAMYDKFYGKVGAFDAALQGIRNCIAAGQRVGLNITLNRRTANSLPSIFDLVEKEGIPRVCFYHLAYTGRGRRIPEDAISNDETRAAMRYIFKRALDFHERGLETEILTVGNHADAAHLYLKVEREQGPERAADAWKGLTSDGGNRSGVTTGHVDNTGNVHPDQFSWSVNLGNVKGRPFGQIWQNTGHPIMAGLKDRRGLLPARCQSCRFLEICNGNLRARAEFATGDFWGIDPACYLTEQEIKIRAGA